MQTNVTSPEYNGNDISSATDSLFLPFKGLFDFGKRKTLPPPQTVGSGLCWANDDLTPFVLSQNYSCPPHFYCPNTKPPNIDPISMPSFCPPSLECQLKRLASVFCSRQGRYEPEACRRGFYCPDYTQKYVCPEGSFCPTGFTKPRPCYPLFSICPEGSAYQTFYGGLVLCLVIDVVWILTYLILRCRRSMRERKRTREESRKISGRSIAVIAETTHSKKNAQFFTLADEVIFENDKESLVSRRGAGLFTAAYWRKRFVILQHKLGFDKEDSIYVEESSEDTSYDMDDSFGAPPEDVVEDPAVAITIPPVMDTVIRSRSSSLHHRHMAGSIHDMPEATPRTTVRRGFAHKHFSLHLNDLLLGFHRAQDGEDLSLTFYFDQLSLKLPSGKTILNGVTGKIVPGKVTVIMGPSGAGKSTFMNVLMGKIKRTGGRLLINGREVEMQAYKKLVGYVPQDDVMLYELSVRENILYSAKNRLPHTWTLKEINKFVDAVLDSLDLSHVADNLITSVSGGQRKRVNIGMELVTCPSAIFLDEPTSGLDSTAALKVANTMKKIATIIGITVVAVVHQPRFEIFTEFDDLLMIAPGGSTAYLGSRFSVIPYFQDMGFYFAPQNNPADILMDIVAGKGLKIPPYFRGEFDTDELAANGEIPFEDYEVTDLVHTWKEYQKSDSDNLESNLDSIDEETTSVTTSNTSDGFGQTNAPTPNSSDEITTEKPRVEFLTVDSAPPQKLTRPFVHFDIVEARKLSILSLADSGGTRTSESEENTKSHLRLQLACQKRGCNFFRQLYHAHNRSIVQQYRLVNGFLLEILVAILTGAVIGLAVSTYEGALYQGLIISPFTIISPAPIEAAIPMLAMISACTIGLAGAPAGVKIFSEEREIYFREASAGLNRYSYYIGKNIASTYRFIISALHFSAFFMFFARPNIYFLDIYIIHLATFFAVYGLAFVCAFLVKRENASMIAVCVSLVVAILNGSGPSLTDMRKVHMGWLLDMSYARWATEAWYGVELLMFDGVFEIWRVSSSMTGYQLDRFWFDIFMIVVIGFVFRLLGLFIMLFTQRQRQK